MECKRVRPQLWSKWLAAKTLSAIADDYQDERRMARFAQYAMVASEEALSDAGWSPTKEEDLEATVHQFLCTLVIPNTMPGRLYGLGYRKLG
jgi:3-oxoacyl-(acyl-carrier-protein) synthase